MRRASKLLITMLTLTVLFAIFAFSASAAEEITWDSNTAFGEANFDVSSDCTITVSGELSVEAQIRIRNDASWVVIEQQEETIEPEDSDASVDAE